MIVPRHVLGGAGAPSGKSRWLRSEWEESVLDRLRLRKGGFPDRRTLRSGRCLREEGVRSLAAGAPVQGLPRDGATEGDKIDAVYCGTPDTLMPSLHWRP